MLHLLSASVNSHLSFHPHHGPTLDMLYPVTAAEVTQELNSSPAKLPTTDIIPTSLLICCKQTNEIETIPVYCWGQELYVLFERKPSGILIQLSQCFPMWRNPSIVALPTWESRPYSNTWFLEPT